MSNLRIEPENVRPGDLVVHPEDDRLAEVTRVSILTAYGDFDGNVRMHTYDVTGLKPSSILAMYEQPFSERGIMPWELKEAYFLKPVTDEALLTRIEEIRSKPLQYGYVVDFADVYYYVLLSRSGSMDEITDRGVVHHNFVDTIVLAEQVAPQVLVYTNCDGKAELKSGTRIGYRGLELFIPEAK